MTEEQEEQFARLREIYRQAIDTWKPLWTIGKDVQSPEEETAWEKVEQANMAIATYRRSIE
jgi:hypothetical protein